MPNTTWNDLQSNEYGFYANVNPEVHHPRWRQDMERRLPQTLFSRQYIETRLFNGYADQVASLYSVWIWRQITEFGDFPAPPHE